MPFLMHQIGKWNLETGLKATYSQTSNDAALEQQRDGGWETDPYSVATSDVTEMIGAAYASVQYALDSATQLTLGARYEHWDRDYGNPALDGHFGKLFPSFFLSRTFASNHQLQLAYNRRISRPSYNDLASYLYYNDPTSVFTGNPQLQPTLADNAKVGYQWKEINVALAYTYEADPIVQYQLVENSSAELAAITPQNMDYQRELAVQTHVPVPVTSWWTINVGGRVGKRQFKLAHTVAKVAKSYWAYNLYANQTLLLPGDFSVEVTSFYNSDHYYGSMKAQGFGMVNLGVKKNLKNNQGSLQLTVTDLFQTMQYVNQYGALTREAFDSRSRVVSQPESGVNRIFQLSFGRSSAFRHRRDNVVGEENSRIRRE